MWIVSALANLCARLTAGSDHAKKVCDSTSKELAFLVSYLVQEYSPVIVQEDKLAITGRITEGLYTTAGAACHSLMYWSVHWSMCRIPSRPFQTLPFREGTAGPEHSSTII